MTVKKKLVSHDVYQPMFIEYDLLSIEELFPVDPFSNNILHDIYKRILHFPVLVRKKLMDNLNWTLLDYYNKMQNSPYRSDSYYKIFYFKENQEILKIIIDCLRIFLDYLESKYVNFLK